MKDDEKIIDMRCSGAEQTAAQEEIREKKSKRFLRSIGWAEMDEISRKKLRKPSFTAKAESAAQAEYLTRLAEEALDAKGKVYAIRDTQKNCVCWGIVTLIVDGREGKKVRSHYEMTVLEAAAGYEDRLASFEKDIIMIIQERMLFTDVQEARINGYIYYPAMPAFWRMPCGNLWFALAFGLMLGTTMNNFALGLAFFAMFLSCGSEERPRVKLSEEAPPEEQ